MSEEFFNLDYVYAGIRLDGKGKKYISVIPIKDNNLEKERFYDYKHDRTGTVGGIYRGCSFSDLKIRAFGQAKFVSMWPEMSDRIRWNALDEESKQQEKLAKLETNAAKISDIDRILLPLRTEYQKMRGRGDYHGANALKNAIVNSLMKTVK